MAARRAEPKRRNDPTGVRERILSAAYGLFQREGLKGTTMSELAAAAGVSSGALHHHFATKKALGLAVIREKVAAAFEETWAAPVRGSSSALAATLDVFRSLAHGFDERGVVLGCPINNLTLELASSDDEYRRALRPMFDGWRDMLAEGLRAEGSALRSSADGAEATAALVVAAYSGAMAMAKAEQRGAPLRRCADELERILAA